MNNGKHNSVENTEGVQTSFSNTTVCLGSILRIAFFEEKEYFYSYIHSTCYKMEYMIIQIIFFMIHIKFLRLNLITF